MNSFFKILCDFDRERFMYLPYHLDPISVLPFTSSIFFISLCKDCTFRPATYNWKLQIPENSIKAET